MIKFFRKIRQKLLRENKFRNYLKYAIGEVILVVIGILIALTLNNINENRKQSKLIIDALQEIHQNISDDIIECNNLISFYQRKDFLLGDFLLGNVSEEEFVNNAQEFIVQSFSVRDFPIDNNGYEDLIENMDAIPTKYNKLIEPIKSMYIRDKNIIENRFQVTFDNLLKEQEHLAKNEKWWSEILIYNYTSNKANIEISNEAIDYLLNNPNHKNYLANHHMLSIGNYYGAIYQFRITAEEIYEKLTKLLNLEDVVLSDTSYYQVDINKYEQFVGAYKDSLNTKRISIESGALFYQLNQDAKIRLIPNSDTSFIDLNGRGFTNMKIDSSGQVISCEWHNMYQKNIMRKVD